MENKESNSLEDILSRTVDEVFNQMHGKKDEKQRKSEKSYQTNETESPIQEQEAIVPLRHSVENRRQEALDFLKELNALQGVQLRKSSEEETAESNCFSVQAGGETNNSAVSSEGENPRNEVGTCAEEQEVVPLRHSVEDRRQEALEFLKELNALQSESRRKSGANEAVEKENSSSQGNSLAVSIEKVRKSFELDKALSEMVDRVYSEIHNEGPTGTAEVARTPLNEMTLNDQEGSSKVTEAHGTGDINTADVFPIIIQPEHECEDESIAMPSGVNNEENITKTKNEDCRKSADEENVGELRNGDSQEVITINIEPIDCETFEEQEAKEQTDVPEHK